MVGTESPRSPNGSPFNGVSGSCACSSTRTEQPAACNSQARNRPTGPAPAMMTSETFRVDLGHGFSWSMFDRSVPPVWNPHGRTMGRLSGVPMFVVGISSARPKTRASVTERNWAYRTNSAFSDRVPSKGSLDLQPRHSAAGGESRPTCLRPTADLRRRVQFVRCKPDQ